MAYTKHARPQTGTVWHAYSYVYCPDRPCTHFLGEQPEQIKYGSRYKPNTYLSICDCKFTIALLKLSKDLCMKLIHEAGWRVPQQVITTAQAVRKQVKQIQAGLEQEFFAWLPVITSHSQVTSYVSIIISRFALREHLQTSAPGQRCSAQHNIDLIEPPSSLPKRTCAVKHKTRSNIGTKLSSRQPSKCQAALKVPAIPVHG